jgi:TonB family protein
MSGIEVLVITTDQMTRKAVLKPWAGGNVRVFDSVTEGMQVLDRVSIDVVALNYNSKLENLQFALNDIRELSPATALIVFCEKQQVQEIVESEISNSIFRVIPKPLSAKQSQLAFRAAYTHHLELASHESVHEDRPIALSPQDYILKFKTLFFVSLITLFAWFGYKVFTPDRQAPSTDIAVENTQQITDLPAPTVITSDGNFQDQGNDITNILPNDPVLVRIDAALNSLPDEGLLNSDAYRLILMEVEAGPLTPEYASRLNNLAPRLQSWGEILVQNRQSSDLQRLTAALRAIPSLVGVADSLGQLMLTETQNPMTIDNAADNAEQNISQPQSTAAIPFANTVSTADKIVAAVKISGRNPRYPKNAERRGIEGYIDLEFTINQMGEVTAVSIMRAEPQGVFDNAAITAVASWRYQPRQVNDQPASEQKQIRLRFSL